MATEPTVRAPIAVSVIIPARNEEDCIAACLASLAAQTGISFEILLVDDASTDRTRAIAGSFAQVRVLDAGVPPRDWSGKNNAVAVGALAARGKWLLFTDADTVHRVGSLAHAVAEADARQVALLSYSPEQEVHTFAEKAVMPVIFAELAATFRPAEISDPASPAAAANGQYILVDHAAYHAVGGHAAVAGSLLEDVALAQAVKRSGRKIFFRFGGDLVRTRMYRSFPQLLEGWTKNLALLFPRPLELAARRAVEFVLLISLPLAGLTALLRLRGSLAAWALAASAAVWALFLRRILRAHFAWDATTLSPFGLPLFSFLLVRSKMKYRAGKVGWKGRIYAASAPVATSDKESLAAARKLKAVP